jgi:methylated-DNA-[protein]-cysteine S-methyltransferase
MTPLPLLYDRIDTPIGRLALVVHPDGRLCAAGFTDGHRRMDRFLGSGLESRLVEARDPGGISAALARYFAGDTRAIDGLPVAPTGTEFQLAVWGWLQRIPCGETWSYGELARRLGRPSAVRAVGLANGANPIAVVVPCHRVIGADGSLTGYGGGIERKRWLLAHERRDGLQLALPAAP